MHLPFLGDEVSFPSPHQALDEPNGLLAVGGDLSVERLLAAYQRGIFPWFSHDDPILWWSPDPRAVFWVDEYAPSRSLKKSVKRQSLRFTLNHAFDEVIRYCADVPRGEQNGTWITEEMLAAYRRLHRAGHAHSIEVWQGDTLVGGLYGVYIDQCFCGESMFHLATDASKAALWALISLLKSENIPMVDCQMMNDHLASLGAQVLPREDFLAKLASHCQGVSNTLDWSSRRINLL